MCPACHDPSSTKSRGQLLLIRRDFWQVRMVVQGSLRGPVDTAQKSAQEQSGRNHEIWLLEKDIARSVTKLVRNALENCQVQGCVGSLIRWSVSWRGLHQAEDCRVLGKVQDMEKGGRTGAWLTEARALSAPHCEKQRQGWTHSWGDPMAIFAYKLQFLLREKGE